MTLVSFGLCCAVNYLTKSGGVEHNYGHSDTYSSIFKKKMKAAGGSEERLSRICSEMPVPLPSAKL